MLLTGNEKLYLDSPGFSYRLVRGNVNVFAVARSAEKQRRLVFLLRCVPGAVIPGIVSASGKTTRFGAIDEQVTLVIAAEGDTELEETEFDPQQTELFLKAVGIKTDAVEDAEDNGASSFDGFAEALWTYYYSVLEKEDDILVRYAHRTGADKKTGGNSFRSLFSRSYISRFADIGDEDNLTPVSRQSADIYSAMRVVCGIRKMKTATRNRLVEAFGANFTASDVAALSGFTCREILLPEKPVWDDFAPLVLLTGDGKHLAVFRRFGVTRYYDPSDGSIGKLSSLGLNTDGMRALTVIRPLDSNVSSLKGIVRFALGEVRLTDVLAYVLTVALVTYVTLIPSKLSGYVYGTLIPTGVGTGIGELLLSIVCCLLGGLMFSVAKGLTHVRITGRIKAAVQTAVYDRLFRLPANYYRDNEPAAISFKSESLPDTFVSILDAVIQGSTSLVMTVVYTIRMSRYSGLLTAVSGGFVLLSVTLSVVLGCLFRKRQIEKSRQLIETRGFLLRMISGIETLRSFGVTETVGNAYFSRLTRYGKADMKLEKSSRLSTFITALTTSASVISVYSLVAFGRVSISRAGFFGFVSLVGSLSVAMGGVGQDVMLFIMMLPVLHNVFDIVETPAENPEKGKIVRDMKGNVTVSNVSFRYNPTQAPVLQNVNLEIKGGEYIGIAGPSGCGKSTLLRLILALDRPQLGKVYYDGIDSERINMTVLRRNLGTVLQNGTLFSGTIESNIMVSDKPENPEAAKEAAELACVADYIESLPMKYSTVLSENGTNVSGGIRQRLMIARAIASKAKILVLDEATSALDNVTQAKICENLKNIPATKIVVAHRLSTLAACDRIYVMDKGQIVESGSMDELMEKQGLFYELAKRQTVSDIS